MTPGTGTLQLQLSQADHAINTRVAPASRTPCGLDEQQGSQEQGGLSGRPHRGDALPVLQRHDGVPRQQRLADPEQGGVRAQVRHRGLEAPQPQQVGRVQRVDPAPAAHRSAKSDCSPDAVTLGGRLPQLLWIATRMSSLPPIEGVTLVMWAVGSAAAWRAHLWCRRETGRKEAGLPASEGLALPPPALPPAAALPTAAPPLPPCV